MNYKKIPLIVSILALLSSHKSFPSAVAAAGAGASRLIATPGGLAIANSENAKEQKEKIDKAKAKLKKFGGDRNWNKRKEIIKHAVTHQSVHPDELEICLYSPLSEALHERDKEMDFEFARFLLINGANPNQMILGDPILERAKTVAMAQLLFDHGAHETVAKHGAELLQKAAVRDNNESELIEWYVQHGVDPNKYYDGNTPLLKTIYHHDGYLDRSSNTSKRVQLLVQAGALLKPSITNPNHLGNGQNVAQILKRKLDDAQRELKNNSETQENANARIASFTAIRNILIAISNYRHVGIKTDLSKYTILLPVLCDLVVGYYIALEPRYEELEAMPVAPIVHPPCSMYVGRGFPLFDRRLRLHR